MFRRALYPAAGVPIDYRASYTCYDACPVGYVRTVGVFDPFPYTPFYKPVEMYGRETVGIFTEEITACLPPEAGDNHRCWWILRAQGYDSVGIIPAGGTPNDADFPPFETVESFTQLKIEIEMVDDRRRSNYVIADIGTGLQACIGPARRLRARLLAPDFDALTNIGFTPPPGLHFTDRTAKSQVHVSAMMSDPVHGEMTYTQPLIFTAGRTSWSLKIPNFAYALHFASNAASGGVGFLRDANGALYPISQVPWAPGTNEEIQIPKEATHVGINVTVPGAFIIGTAIFKLRV